MKTMVWNRLLVFMMISTVMGVSVKTSEAEDVYKIQTMEDVVVTATRTTERIMDVPVTTEVITREKIEMSGATHVGDLIGKYITGHYHKYNGLLSPVGLRGFRTDAHGDDVKGHVLILVDGHRIGTGNAAKLNVDRIERIEVIKGPASALYGSAAMGGVINLITRKGQGKPSLTLSGDYGSFNYYKGRVSGEGEVNERFRFHAVTSYEDVDDYDDPKFGTVYNTWETKKNFGMNLSYALTSNHELRLGGNYADLTGGYPSWANFMTYGGYVKSARQNYDKSHGYADLEYNGDFFDKAVHWRALGYYLWDRNHWNYGSPDPESDQTKYTDTTWGTDHQFTWNTAPWNTLVFGLNLEKLEKESSGVSGGQPAAPFTPGMEYNSQAYFLQDALDVWNNRVNIVGAVRYDRFELTTRKPKTGTFASFVEKDEAYNHTSPKLGIGIKFLDELLRVRGNVGQGFKSPSADQLSAQYKTNTNVTYVGNPDLDPETSLTYDIGFDIFHDLLTFRTAYFHTDYKDKIVQTTTTLNGQRAVTWRNSGDARIAGFDLNLAWAMGRTFHWPLGLSLWSNVTFNTTKKDEETNKDLNYISDYEVKSGLDLQYNGFSAQLSYVLVGPQMIDNWDTWPATTEKKGSFNFWDMTLRYRFANHWEVRGSVLNLFNDRVEWVRGYLMPKRNYLVGVSYTF
ncbi:MAG: TonB-dependent receptor plug domain-containing protein [Desulfosoma sp.]|uniref:TonB-dependent receptor plug domain-containing protein n=1 Tax=Desulfosoma sp. TaxID=2603217 RepID=UPI00404A45F0